MLHIKNKQVRASNFLQRLLISCFIILSSKGCRNDHKGLRHGTSTHDLVHPTVKSTGDQPFTVNNQEVSDPEPKELEQKEGSDPEPKELEQEIKKVKEKLEALQNLQKDQALSIQCLQGVVHTMKVHRSKCSNCNCGKNYEEQTHSFENALQLPIDKAGQPSIENGDHEDAEDDNGYESDSNRSGDGRDDDEKEDGDSKQAKHDKFYENLGQMPGIGGRTISKIKQAYDSPSKILERSSELPAICGSKSPSRAKAVLEAAQKTYVRPNA